MNKSGSTRGCKREINGRLCVHYCGDRIRAYLVPADTLRPK